MKILLAPLFFRQRMCKHCAKIHYRNNPGSWLGLYEFESLPPLGSFDKCRGFVPDFPALLMFDEFMMDTEAYDRINQPGRRAWLVQWTELVHALKSEGALSLVDVTRAASSDVGKRSWMIRRDLQDPERWWQTMSFFDSVAGRASRFMGESPAEAQDFAWEFDPEAQFGVEGKDGQVHDLSVVLLESKHSRTKAHRDLYTQAFANLRTQLQEVNACLSACKELAVAPMMWAPYRRYLQEKLSPADQNIMQSADAGRKFFNIAFPAYAPTTVRQFLKLRSDRRLNALRSEILKATESGELDPQYPQRVLSEVLRLELKAGRIRNIIGWIATAAGAIPIPGLGIGMCQ